MHLVLSISALAAAAAATSSAERAPLQSPQVREVAAPEASEQVCRDRIERVREERGLSERRAEPASPDNPVLIAAVDRRIGGCSVLVMRNDTRDIRPLPVPPEGTAGLMPAH